jgi:hypothetical protein
LLCRATTKEKRRFGSNLIVVDRSRSAGASLIKQAIAAILQKSAAPLANGVFVQPPHPCSANRPRIAE